MDPITREIARRGPVTFARFMELALYHARAGYYTRSRRGAGPAGAEGDFLTAPTAEPLFARTLGTLLRRLTDTLGTKLTFVELGSGEGILLTRLLEALGERRADTLERVAAVEIGAWARERIIARCTGVDVAMRLDGLERPRGPVLLFMSELYDALPVHRVTMRRRAGVLELAEFHVQADAAGGLAWSLGVPSTSELADYLHERGVRLEEGQIAELRPALDAKHERALRWCGDDAVALVLDYGYATHQLYNPRGRSRGTLTGYRSHRTVDDVLVDPGRVDITAHINFDDLARAAEVAGWASGPLVPLGPFLAMHGALDLLPAPVENAATLRPEEWAALGGAKRLLSPAGMGSDLKVLAQGRGRAWEAYRRIATPPPVDA